jgi:acetyl esterase/lipase
MGITEKEAEPVALKLLSEGFCAFVLRYSIGAGEAAFPGPMIDIAEAILIVRENAGRWGIDPDRVSLCGFSAGGHAAAFFAATWQEDYLTKVLKIEPKRYKPNALLLGYPILNLKNFKEYNEERSVEMKTVLELMFGSIFGTDRPEEELLQSFSVSSKVTTSMPPVFLWTTSEDSYVALEDHLEFIKSLADNHILHEFHVFEKGEHGISLADRTTGLTGEQIGQIGNTHRWPELAIAWLRNR